MKKILVILLMLVFMVSTAQATITHGASYYLLHKGYVGSGNKTLDPAYLFIGEAEAVLNAGVSGASGVTFTGDTVNFNSGSTAASNYACNIGAGTSTGTVTIGGTGIQAIAVGNGAAAKTVALGSSNTTSTTTILSGSNGVSINASNNQPTNINSGTSTGTVTIGGSGAQTITIGSTGIETINIGAGGTGAKTITIGDAASTGTTAILSGSGGLTLNNNGSVATLPARTGYIRVATAATTITGTNPSVNLSTASLFTYSPTDNEDETITGTGMSTIPGAVTTIEFLSVGTADEIITFGTGFKVNGTITLSATAGKYSTITFVSDGTYWVEIARQATGV